MNHITRILAVITVFMAVVQPSGAKNIDGINYSLNSTEKTASVKGFATGKDVAKLVIPDKVISGGVTYKVTAIAKNAFDGNDVIRSVQIGDYVETIGSYAFSETYLTKVTMGARIRIIGEMAFYNSDVTEVVFPSTLQIIRKNAFISCLNLKRITFQGAKLTEIGESAFAGCDKLSSVSLPSSVRTLGVAAFQGCVSLTKLSLPQGLTAIPKDAFDRCPIDNLSFPASVTSIGDGAFAESATPDLYIPGTIKSIGASAFAMSKATSVALCEGTVSIGNYAFSEMPNLTAITLPKSVTSLGTRVFYRSALREAYLSPSVKVLPEGLFYECDLRYVDIPEGVTQIGEWTFRNNPHLTNVRIPGSVKVVGKEAFSLCAIENLALEDGVETIAEKAFLPGLNAVRIDLPASIRSIGSLAFPSFAIREVRVANLVPCSLADDGFWNETYERATLVVPDGAVDAYRAAPGWRNFAYICSESDEGSIEDVMADTEVVATRYFGIDGVELPDAPAGRPYIREDVTAGGKRIVSKHMR